MRKNYLFKKPLTKKLERENPMPFLAMVTIMMTSMTSREEKPFQLILSLEKIER